MKNAIHALIAGTIFGVGLTVSGMVNPEKILNFLDFGAIPSGGWDPTLAFVFAGALAVSFIGLLIRRSRSRPVAAESFHEPDPAGRVNVRLIGGAAIFGIGWGMTGLCPGPALSALGITGFSATSLLIFVAAMASGMIGANVLKRS